MALCKNCFLPIVEEEAVCLTCNAPLHKECAINEGGTFCDVCYTVKTEEVPKLEFEIPEFIRRSYIELYKTCPFKFYNEVILGMTSPTNIYALLGIDLHEFFSKACMNKKYLQGDMVSDFEITWNCYDPLYFQDPTLKAKLYKRGHDCIESFYNVLKTLPDVPYRSEETIQFPVGDNLPLVQCTSDRVDLIDGELELTDWKTGKVMVGQKFSTDLQAPLYIYSLRHKYQLPVRKFTLQYLDENKVRVFNRVSNDDYECMVNNRKYSINIMNGVREVQQMFAQIKKGNFNIPRETKNMYYTCKWCHLQTQGVCKGADVESWRQYNGGGR